jgi:hypothetical protein
MASDPAAFWGLFTWPKVWPRTDPPWDPALVTAHREGRHVIYTRTAKGDNLSGS